MSDVLFFYIIGGILVGLVTFGVWAFAASSRKSYSCKACGENFKGLEFMQATHCSVCGAQLQENQ